MTLIWSITRSVNSELRALEKLVTLSRSSLKWEVPLKTFVDTSIPKISGCHWRQMLIKSPGCVSILGSPSSLQAAWCSRKCIGGCGGALPGICIFTSEHLTSQLQVQFLNLIVSVSLELMNAFCPMHSHCSVNSHCPTASLLITSDLLSFPDFFQSWYSLRQDSE